MISSATQWITWGINRTIDNEGGQQHELYLRMAQLGVYFWPAVLMLQFARIYNAYDRTISVDTVEYSVYCGNSKCTQGRTYFNYAYVPSSSDFNAAPANRNYEVRIADTEQYDNLALFFFSTLFSVAVSQRAVGAIKADFDKARLMADSDMKDGKWMEQEEEEA